MAAMRDARFRANPAYDLVPRAQMPPELLLGFSDALTDDTFFGVLLPKDGSPLHVQLVDSATAGLWQALQRPGLVPPELGSGPAGDQGRELAKLVLAQVLEFQVDGRYCSGPAAFSRLFGDQQEPCGDDAVSRLSRQALAYANALPIEDAQVLSARLYFFNRVPVSAAQTRALASPSVILRHLGLDTKGSALATHWQRSRRARAVDGWTVFVPRHGKATRRPAFKLYVAPTFAALGRTVAATLEAISPDDVCRFKLGRDVYGLLRPDKMVLYCDDFPALQRTAERLLVALQGIPAQPVPFTAALSDDGLLSWGADPPPDQAQVLSWQERESWRLWVTNRLAAALLEARRDAAVDACRFALRRLELEGVDVGTWAPRHDLWRRDGQGTDLGDH